MSGIAIKVECRDVVYFPEGAEIAEHAPEILNLTPQEDRELSRHPRLRRVLTTVVRPVPKLYGVLHWSDGTDLVSLDQKARDGVVVDQDFVNALLAEPRSIVCVTCGAESRCLAVDTGQALFAGSMAERLRGHRFEKACPVCGAAFTVPIVEFLHLDPPNEVG